MTEAGIVLPVFKFVQPTTLSLMASNFQHLLSTERGFSSFIQSCKSVLPEVSVITSATVPDIQCTALDHLEVLEIRLYEVYLSFGVIAENLEEG